MRPLLILAVAVGALAACAADPDPETRTDPAPRTDAYVCVATFSNPSVFPDGKRAWDRIHAILDEAGIEHVAAGSRGFSLNVNSEDADRARELIRKLIEREKIQAFIHGG